LEQPRHPPIARSNYRVLILFHGYALAHTIRPLVVGRALAERGYDVVFAGRGPHAGRIEAEGFALHDVETMPQERMDRYVSQGNYNYYDMEWTDRCVSAERALVQRLRPHLLVHDMRPTAPITASLEGVDEIRITQAYNHPAYKQPFEIPEGWISELGPFEEYLLQRASQVQHRRQINALADVPQYHPVSRNLPGYYYVGSLLDRPDAPDRLPLLDEGWDLDLPLVYLTCGSSGREPDYLKELVEAVATEPLRLFITTAGRYKLTDLPSNVRAVDFMPGEWVLERAQVMAGIVGIGAVYQALGNGVPVVAAAEHLDQEYHLASLERLNMGVRLERRAWSAPHIIAALKTVLAQRDGAEWGQESQKLAQTIRDWSGGGRFADLVDSHFNTGKETYRLDQTYIIEEGEFLRCLEASTPDDLGRRELMSLLQQGQKGGMPYRRRGGRNYYDQLDSWNWLYEKSPRFFAADYWALEKKRHAVFSRQSGQLQSKREWQDYRIRCSVRLSADGFRAGQKIKVFLPYPIEVEGRQRQVRLLGCVPEAMMANFVPALGGFYGFTFEADPSTVDQKAGWDFSYECQISVAVSGVVAARLDSEQRRRYLEIESRLQQRAEVAAFFARCGADRHSAPEAIARSIYDELMDATRFRKTKDPVQTSAYSVLSVISRGEGHCVTLSRAFIALCRLRGIPAREACGALFGYPKRDGVYQASTYNEPMLGHTWAEIFIEGKGWMPVEFHGIVIGDNARTADNATDPLLRQAIAANGAAYRDYYFGHLDHTRMLLSTSVRRQPLCLAEKADATGWDVPQDMRYEMQLQAEAV
jgi:UDP:flavonoid glycosyltransferase YjiC (YdhE family)